MTCARAALVAALVAACAQPPEPEPEPEPMATPCADGTYLSYENFGRPFLADWCTACHSSHLGAGERQGAPLGVDLDALEAARGLAERIAARSLGDAPTMPPLGGPGDEERALLAEWLACDLPE